MVFMDEERYRLFHPRSEEARNREPIDAGFYHQLRYGGAQACKDRNSDFDIVGPGSKPVPLEEEEMANLGIKQEDIVVDFEVGDTVTVLSGAWEGTVGMIQAINEQKQSLSINVELFGRETPVELNFSEVRKMD